jgi:cell division protease FtsH
VNRFFRSALFPLIVIVLLVYLASQTLIPRRAEEKKVTYSDLIAQVEQGNVNQLTFNPNKRQINATLVSGQKVKVNYPSDQSQFALQQKLEQENVKFDSKGTGGSWWGSLLISILPFILLIGFWIFLMNQVQGGGSKVMSFGKSRAKRMTPDAPKIGFKDVAGVDEAVEELHEIKEFLENPKKFQALGARIPKGVLLYGPPGTGKTLLARAVAGEAGVPFFSSSASEFIEAIVGIGASRVRDLFNQAKESAPAIVFIDELDAIGRARGGGAGVGGHDEREQTLNQILTEMDGFDSGSGVIVLGATNRPDVLDPALLRPGRFDRRVAVQSPDSKGREMILRVHTRSVPLAEDVDLEALAQSTPGMVGADLANLVNEAALLAARRGHQRVQRSDFTEALERILLGAERKIVLTEDDRRRIAYHEGGHAIVGMLTPGADPVRKVSIIPRGQALGVTLSTPEDDRFNYSEEELRAKIRVALGGRVAEEIIYGVPTTGAESDIQQVTMIARGMVQRWGMSERVGFITVARQDGQTLLLPGAEPASEATQELVDAEVRQIVEEEHRAVRALLTENRDRLDALADALLERETLDEADAYAVAGIDRAPAPGAVVSRA